MTLTDETPITIQFPDDGDEILSTWGEYRSDNDDPEMLADVAKQIAEHNYATIGGGAAPLIWIFA